MRDEVSHTTALVALVMLLAVREARDMMKVLRKVCAGSATRMMGRVANMSCRRRDGPVEDMVLDTRDT